MCGGHGRLCMPNDALVIDMFHMNKVEVDPEKKQATVQGGAYLRDVDKACAPHKLATTFGHYGGTGVGGLVLSGGYGWLARKFGLSVENLLEMTMVLADGSVVTVNEDSHEELFWACKGGGGNFGVVVDFKFRLHELAESILFNTCVFLQPMTSVRSSILQRAIKFFENSSDEENSLVVLPGGAPVVVCMASDFSEGATAKTSRLNEFRSKVGGWNIAVENKFEDLNYWDDVQTIIDDKSDPGFFYTYVCCIEGGGPDVCNILTKAASNGTKRSAIILLQIGGKCGAVTPGLPHSFSKGDYWVLVQGSWEYANQREKVVDWLHDVKAKLQPYTVSSSSHATSQTLDMKGKDVFLDHLPRLQKVKMQYDPENTWTYCSKIEIGKGCSGGSSLEG